MAPARIVHIGTPESNPKKYGKRDKRGGKIKRGGKMLPRSKRIPGYGRVRFFTLDYGKYRTGVLLTMRVLSGRLRGYTLRYMHLAAIHPSLRKGSVVEAGQEVGLMGGTAVQEDAPHVHLDVINRNGKSIDVGPLFGIGRTRGPCRAGKKAKWEVRKKYTAEARKLMGRFARNRAKSRPLGSTLTGCGRYDKQGGFDGGKEHAHRLRINSSKSRGKWRFTFKVKSGQWKPRIQIRSSGDSLMHTGLRARSWARRQHRARTINNGRRSGVAIIELEPRGSELIVFLGAWGRRRPPRGGQYQFVIDRPCKRSKK